MPSSLSLLRAVAPAVFLVLSGCISGWGSSEEPTEFEIGPRGGRFRVEQGSLEGLVLEVPAGALTETVTLSVRLDDPDPLEPLLVVGPAARIEPVDLPLRRPVLVTLPYADALVPFGAGAPRPILRAATADAAELATVEHQPNAPIPIVRTRASSLGTFWVASPPGAPGLETERYFPLVDGGVWEFPQRVSIHLEWRDEIPNLNAGAWVWTLRLGAQALSSYLQPFEGGGLRDLGREVPHLGFQEVLDQPLVLFPGELSGARRVLGESETSVFSPIGSEVPSGRGSRVLRTDLIGLETVVAPAGTFADALEVELLQVWEAPGANGGLQVQLWLAPGVGPVQIRLGGLGLELPLSRYELGAAGG